MDVVGEAVVYVQTEPIAAERQPRRRGADLDHLADVAAGDRVEAPARRHDCDVVALAVRDEEPAPGRVDHDCRGPLDRLAHRISQHRRRPVRDVEAAAASLDGVHEWSELVRPEGCDAGRGHRARLSAAASASSVGTAAAAGRGRRRIQHRVGRPDDGSVDTRATRSRHHLSHPARAHGREVRVDARVHGGPEGRAGPDDLLPCQVHLDQVTRAKPGDHRALAVQHRDAPGIRGELHLPLRLTGCAVDGDERPAIGIHQRRGVHDVQRLHVLRQRQAHRFDADRNPIHELPRATREDRHAAIAAVGDVHGVIRRDEDLLGPLPDLDLGDFRPGLGVHDGDELVVRVDRIEQRVVL